MYVFNVQDMTCGGCAASVRKAVSGVPGVNSINANPVTKEVIVEAAAEVSREAIITAINTAGYRKITVVETAS